MNHPLFVASLWSPSLRESDGGSEGQFFAQVSCVGRTEFFLASELPDLETKSRFSALKIFKIKTGAEWNPTPPLGLKRLDKLPDSFLQPFVPLHHRFLLRLLLTSALLTLGEEKTLLSRSQHSLPRLARVRPPKRH